MSRSLAVALIVLTLPGVALAQPGAGTIEQVSSFGANPGALQMHLYTPSPAPAAGAPVVLALHGCTQNVTTFRSTGWEPLADAHGFYVVYPAQTSANNPVSCFNWAGEYGDEANMRRGEGENQSIISMVDHMQSSLGVDASRVFITGHSAGAAMVMVMLATWPERFAAGAVTAAIPYRCANSVGSAFSCQSPGRDQAPSAWGDLVRAASSHSGPWPRLSIWHGTSDGIVAPMNQTEVLEQWTDLTGASATPDATEMVDGYPHATFGGGRIETWEITGAGHATFVDPDNGCGMTASYVTDANICSTSYQARFFGLMGGPTMPPPGTDAGVVPPGTDAGTWGGMWGSDAGSWGGMWGTDAGPGGGNPPADGGAHDCPGGCAAAPGRGLGAGRLGLLALLGLALALRRRR